MDTQAIDQQYTQLQAQSQQTANEINTLAEKLRTAAQSGNQDAREWMLDLKEIALALQAEQNQVGALLQALHSFVVNQASVVNQARSAPPVPSGQWPAASAQPWGGQPQPPPGYPAQPYPPQPGGTAGMLGSFMNSGFGRAITTGAGFGIGDDLINRIFGGFGGRRGC
jgi:hypothetical protein